MAEITKDFWKNITTLAAIVVGVFYMQSKISDTIREELQPLKDEVKEIKQDLKTLEPKVQEHQIKINQFENYFIKPKDVEIRRKR